MDDEVLDSEEGVDRLGSGRIRLRFGGVAYTLRRPHLGEMRELRAALAAVDEDSTIPGSDPARVDMARRQVLFTGWMRALVKQLGDRELPDDDDQLPPWIASTALTTHLFVHWQTVPLAPGVE